MNDAEFKRLDLSKFATLSNGERSTLLRAMTAQHQKQAVAAVAAAYIGRNVATKAKATPKPAQRISDELVARVYAKRAGESAPAKQTNARGPVFGSEEYTAAVFAKRAQASGSELAASTQRG